MARALGEHDLPKAAGHIREDDETWAQRTSPSPFATRPIRTERGKELFLVDPGATDSLVPRPHLESIGLRPKGQRVYELADGREIVMEITTADIEFMGETVGGTILFGNADAEPLLGVTALASVGIEVDPNNQRLKRLPAVRLKSLRQPISRRARQHQSFRGEQAVTSPEAE